MIRVALRRLARWYLLYSWRNSLKHGDWMRFNHYGATGNPNHGPYSWVEDDYPSLTRDNRS